MKTKECTLSLFTEFLSSVLCPCLLNSCLLYFVLVYWILVFWETKPSLVERQRELATSLNNVQIDPIGSQLIFSSRQSTGATFREVVMKYTWFESTFHIYGKRPLRFKSSASDNVITKLIEGTTFQSLGPCNEILKQTNKQTNKRQMD